MQKPFKKTHQVVRKDENDVQSKTFWIDSDEERENDLSTDVTHWLLICFVLLTQYLTLCWMINNKTWVFV